MNVLPEKLNINQMSFSWWAFSKLQRHIIYEICQNSNNGNSHQNKWPMKITAQKKKKTVKEGINNAANTKEGTDGQT